MASIATVFHVGMEILRFPCENLYFVMIISVKLLKGIKMELISLKCILGNRMCLKDQGVTNFAMRMRQKQFK